ncbi:PilZ domain-containing protein [Sporosarcina sp. 179-K 3D1 HS]|uniref:flagellar brake protein n=1 Tax=Sporosarcina sp. 179-K 3D1 HS TaxID=3232169 RepID=UPI0039A1C11B
MWKVHRRNYFRVPISLTITIEVSPGETQKFVTDDISGGGLAFFNNLSDQFKIGDELTGNVSLYYGSSSEAVPFKGRVVGIRLISKNKFRVAVEFIEMKEPVRTEIIRYCYKRQFEIREKIGKFY